MRKHGYNIFVLFLCSTVFGLMQYGLFWYDLRVINQDGTVVTAPWAYDFGMVWLSLIAIVGIMVAIYNIISRQRGWMLDSLVVDAVRAFCEREFYHDLPMDSALALFVAIQAVPDHKAKQLAEQYSYRYPPPFMEADTPITWPEHYRQVVWMGVLQQDDGLRRQVEMQISGYRQEYMRREAQLRA